MGNWWFALSSSHSKVKRHATRRMRRSNRVRPRLELLEDRDVPALVGFAHTNYIMSPFAGGGVGGFSPAQIKHAYGIDGIRFAGLQGDGSGTTIVITDAFNQPNIVA